MEKMVLFSVNFDKYTYFLFLVYFQVVMPSRHGDLFTYNQQGAGHSDYDIPPSRYNTMNGSAPGSNSSSREDLLNASGVSCEQSFYDTPPSCKFNQSDLSVYDTPPSHLGLDQFDMSGGGSVRTSLMSKYSDETMSMSSGVSCSKSNPSVCDSARSSMDISPMDMYDVPPSSKMYGIRSSKDSGLDMYDSPPKVKSPPSVQDDYDVPRVSAMNNEREKHFRNIHIPEQSCQADFLEDYDVPPSRNQCGLSIPNTPAKADSSDLEEYDVPKHNQSFPVTGKPPIAGRPKPRQKSNSLGCILDDYDTPHNNLPTKISKDDMYTKSSTGKSYDPEVSDDENNYDEPDPIKFEDADDNTGAKSRTLTRENAIDEIYDSPRSNAPVKNITKEFSAVSISSRTDSVYDVPPQVTRDSIASFRSDSSDSNDAGSSRLSTCSSDSRSLDFSPYPSHDELPLDLDAANDLVIKRQQDVQKAAEDFYKLVHGSMRKKESFEHKQYEIKEASLKVEQTLGDFVGFAQGTLANSAKLNDRKLINKLSKHLIPLVQAHQQIKVCIKHLDDVNWQFNKATISESQKKDDIGTITSLTKDLNSDVKKLSSFIQTNSSLLFKRAKDFTRSSKSMEHSTPVSAGKPPAGRKPAIPAKTTPLQDRPLPAPPPKERPLPPTPTDKKGDAFGFNTLDTKLHSGEYVYRNSAGEFKHRTGDIQVKQMSIDRNSEADGTYNAEDLREEYDYVELEDEEDKMKDEERKEMDKLMKTITEVSVDKTHATEEHTNDSYEKEMEKTLDDIEGVNIYSDDSSGTLKRGMQLPEGKAESDNESGTLKRKPESDEAISEQNSDTLKREAQPDEMCEKEKTAIEMEQERVEVPEHDTEPNKHVPLESEDRQVLSFYSEQLDTHMTLLSNSIEAFFQCIETNQGPKVFISHSKFVVVSAHKLVYIGDSLHQNLKHLEVRNNIIQKANCLCDWLKHTVTSTKTAALQYPSVPAVQDMVNKVTAVSHAARDLKEFVIRVSKQF